MQRAIRLLAPHVTLKGASPNVCTLEELNDLLKGGWVFISGVSCGPDSAIVFLDDIAVPSPPREPAEYVP